MREDLRFLVPDGMTPEIVARTFAAYLIGSLAYENPRDLSGDWREGPYRTDGDRRWQLDITNDFWLQFEYDGTAWLDHRNPHDKELCQAMVALFSARYPYRRAKAA